MYQPYSPVGYHHGLPHSGRGAVLNIVKNADILWVSSFCHMYFIDQFPDFDDIWQFCAVHAVVFCTQIWLSYLCRCRCCGHLNRNILSSYNCQKYQQPCRPAGLICPGEFFRKTRSVFKLRNPQLYIGVKWFTIDPLPDFQIIRQPNPSEIKLLVFSIHCSLVTTIKQS